jgi:hypothetical protein
MLYCSDDIPRPQQYTIIGRSEVLAATCLLVAVMVDVDQIRNIIGGR